MPPNFVHLDLCLYSGLNIYFCLFQKSMVSSAIVNQIYSPTRGWAPKVIPCSLISPVTMHDHRKSSASIFPSPSDLPAIVFHLRIKTCSVIIRPRVRVCHRRKVRDALKTRMLRLSMGASLSLCLAVLSLRQWHWGRHQHCQHVLVDSYLVTQNLITKERLVQRDSEIAPHRNTWHCGTQRENIADKEALTPKLTSLSNHWILTLNRLV